MDPYCKRFQEIEGQKVSLLLCNFLSLCFESNNSLVRAESTLLKSQIECNMPNLKVDMLPRGNNSIIDGTVLQGQVSDWILRVTNQGTAIADKITLKTNVPWMNLLGPGSRQNGGDECNLPTSYCVGPSGTLMYIPIVGDQDHGSNDVLKPGQTADIPIQLRTSGGGRQDFYMLFRYELLKDSLSSSMCPKVRWLRNMVSVAVYPSLTVTASLMPSFKGENDHILSVEVSKKFIQNWLLLCKQSGPNINHMLSSPR